MRIQIYVSASLALFHLSTPALPLPPKIEAVVRQTCAELVAQESDLTDPQIVKLLQHLTDVYGPRLPNFETDYLPILIEYMDSEGDGGRSLFHAAADVQMLLERYVTPNLSPTDLRLRLEDMVRRMQKVRGSTRVPHGRLALSQLKLSTRDPELVQMLADFERTGLGIYLIDARSYFDLRVRPAAGAFVASFSHDEEMFVLFRDLLVDIMRIAIGNAMAFFHAIPVARPDGSTYPAGIYIREEFNHSAFEELLIHEMSHPVQDAVWDLEYLAAYYVTEKRRTFQDHGLPSADRKRLTDPSVGRTNWFTEIRDPNYRHRVLENGQRGGMDAADQVLFVDLFRFLRELDAHLKAQRFATEQGDPIPYLTRDKVFAYVQELYEQKGSILPEIHQLMGESPMFELLEFLNTHPRPQSTTLLDPPSNR